MHSSIRFAEILPPLQWKWKCLITEKYVLLRFRIGENGIRRVVFCSIGRMNQFRMQGAQEIVGVNPYQKTAASAVDVDQRQVENGALHI